MNTTIRFQNGPGTVQWIIIICRFNWKYKSQCTHHYGQLWYTPCRLMHDGTSQMWRVTCVTFKYHGTLGNLIGVHLNGCPCILLSEITSSTVSFYCRLDWQYCLSCGHFLHLTEQSSWCCCCCCSFFASISLTQLARSIPTFNSCIIWGVWLYQYDISSGSGGACMVVHLKKELQAPRTSPYGIAQSVMLYQ